MSASNFPLIGILGGGQLARMIALAGIPLGFRFRVFDPSPDACAQVCAEHVCAAYDDEAALSKFAAGVDVITYEFENVPTSALDFLEQKVAIHPTREALRISQDRVTEKVFFRSLGLPVGDFWQIDTAEDLKNALQECEDGILKTRRFGYDGKGQQRIKASELNGDGDIEKLWKEFGENPSVLEKLVPFDRELSVIGVRNTGGETMVYDLFLNRHSEGILDHTIFPAPDSERVFKEAKTIISTVMESLDYVGVLAIELFDCKGKLSINEMAPRVHNSGHVTQDFAKRSQFENHVRAITGMPVENQSQINRSISSVMINLIGAAGDLESVHHDPGMKLHLYGKSERPGRKIGHVNFQLDDPKKLDHMIQCVRGKSRIK